MIAIETSSTQTASTPNRLAQEKSPYLLQHAHQPVDWYPWSEEAFEIAAREDKPIFLSVGYAACHWCHVMAHESFDAPDTAALLNDAFVCIKVDREERPDVDHIYMEVCQRMTGSGGWPLTVLLTPEKKPFFAATYIPREGRYGRRGLNDIVPEVKNLWHRDKEAVLQAAEKITEAVRAPERPRVTVGKTSELPDESALHGAFQQLQRSFDPVHAGFGSGTKFPSPHQLSFLLRYHLRYGNEEAAGMALRTLDAMRAGGIYDHVGFGFHRYSVDPMWRVPHFEKMLYDQAMLLITYTEAYELTKDASYRNTSLEISDYLIRDLRDPGGAFHSAEDADAEGAEGKFYTWTEDELHALLGADAEEVCRLFHVSGAGNFEDPHGEVSQQNVLYKSPSTETDRPVLQNWWEVSRRLLFDARNRRVRPQKDDKILTDWNGLTIAALAHAGRMLGRPNLLEAAREAHRFIETHLTLEDGRLQHRYRDGESFGDGNLNDYAFYAWGLLELFEADRDPTLLSRAEALAAMLLTHFVDPDGGAFFFTADDTEVVLTRFKDRYDGAIPSGNAVAYQMLGRLHRLTAKERYREAADRIAGEYINDLRTRPIAHTQFLVAVEEQLDLACTGPACALPVK